MVGATEDPGVDFLDGQLRDEIDRDSGAMSHRQFGGGVGALLGGGVPVADEVVGLVLDQVKIRGDDFADRAAEALEISRLPVREICDLLSGEALPRLLGGIVDALAELVAKKRHQLAPPKRSGTLGERDRTAKICEHDAELGNSSTPQEN